MGKLQALLDSVLEKHSNHHKIVAAVLRKKLKEKGIALTEAQMADLESQLVDLTGNGIAMHLDDNLPTKLNLKLKDEINDLRLDLSLSEDDIEDFVAQAIEAWSEVLPHLVEDTAHILLKQLRKNAAALLSARKKDRIGFETRLAKRWRKPLRLLEMLLAIALEAGDDFNREFRAMAAEENNQVFEVLIRLHARACQIASEVLVLLKSGHADGAHARWRSLHEIAVVGVFIKREGNEIARRYLAHDGVESCKAARQYQKHYARLGFEPISEAELKHLQSVYKRLVDHFGDAYRYDYGWAAPVLGNKKPSFMDIEQKVGLDHFRPFYKLASHNVHANPKGVFHKLGLFPGAEDVLLAGPSNAGLVEPGQGTAISLSQITATLLGTRPTMDTLVISAILVTLMDEIQQEFATAQMSLVAQESGDP
jgi:hypothetical protein